MATQAQIDRIWEKLNQTQPTKLFKSIDATQIGIGAVLRLLYVSQEPVTAGKISDALQISTARVAVLLKKMEAKELITKARDTADARVTIVRLTEYGAEVIGRQQEELRKHIALVLDTVGAERMETFFTTLEDIRDIAQPPTFLF